jgi:hypothetical protein
MPLQTSIAFNMKQPPIKRQFFMITGTIPLIGRASPLGKFVFDIYDFLITPLDLALKIVMYLLIHQRKRMTAVIY